MSLGDWGAILTALSKVPDLIAQVNANELRLHKLESALTTAENTLAALDSVTNSLADDTASIAAKLQALQDAIASGNQAAVSAAMDTLSPDIAKLQATEATLRGLGADQANPVPATS